MTDSPPAATAPSAAAEPEMTQVLQQPQAPQAPQEPQVPHLQAKAAALLLLLAALLLAVIGYLLYARGAFEPTQRLVLVADNSEGVLVGMDLTFAGFAIGRVRRIELGDDGNARIIIDVPRKDARWLRSSSVFTLVRGFVGNTNLRAYSGILSDPPLLDNAERRVLAGDASAEIPKMVAAVRELVQHITALAAPDAALAGSLANLKTTTDRLNGPGGALGLLLGKPDDAAKLMQTLERTNALLARVDTLTGHVDSLVLKADAQVFGNQGLMPQAQSAISQLAPLLTDARATLSRVDALLAEAQGIAANARSATTDLAPLRAEVEASLRKLQGLMDQLNRKWPFARDSELKLP